MRAKDERGIILKKSAGVVVFSLPTSIVLTFIFIPSSHFPQRGKQGIEMFIKKQIKPASKPTRVFYKLSRKSFKSVFCLGDNADNLSK